MKGIYLIIIQLFFSLFSWCASPTDCKNDLLDYVKRMATIKKPEGKKIYQLGYTIQYDYRPNSEQKDINDVVKIKMSSKKSFFESQNIQMYIDEKEGFLIVPLTQQIIWGNGNNSAIGDKNFEYMAAFQDSLIRFSEIENCSTRQESQIEYKQVKLIPVPKLRNYMHVKDLLVTYNVNSKMIEKVIIQYDEKSELEKMVVIYNEMNFDYQGDFDESAHEMVFAKKKLLPKYSQFELIDNRISKKNK